MKLVLDGIVLGELAEAFTEAEAIDRGRSSAFRSWIVFARGVPEENAMPRRWRNGMGPT
ncbi:MAG: hypothetical protein JSR31_08610 [Nitrospira sp.]|nr:hypothetical protein [Nitrospira sp.]